MIEQARPKNLKRPKHKRKWPLVVAIPVIQ